MGSLEMDSSYLIVALLAYLVPALIALVLNVVFGIIAVNMAKKRGMKPVPAFFVAFFTSFIGLLIIGMFPVKENWER